MVYERFYATSFDPIAGVEIPRHDVMLAPGVIVILHDLLIQQGDLRFDYHYQHNDSIDPLRPFINHLITAASVIRF